MKRILVLAIILTATCFFAVAQTQTQKHPVDEFLYATTSQPATTANIDLRQAQTKDVSLLQPADVAYENAAEFARFLKAEGVEVRSIHRSTLEGFFKGIGKAAFFRTDKGIVEVVFFSGALDAEKVSITYSRNESKAVPHKYRVEGQPAQGGGVIHATYPVYFTLHKSWYIVTSDAEMDSVLKRSLGQSGRRN